MTISFFRKSLTAVALAASLAAVAAPSAQAWPIFPHPHHHHIGWGPGLGLGLGLGLLGAAAAADYSGSAYCHTERRVNEYGEYIGRVRVCE
jgi:hypothetical protein